MSTQKSFLDDDGLQRLWQKITATVTNSVSAAINALPSWAKSETKPSYTVSEISGAVSDTTFNNHVNDTNAHVSESDREIWNDVTRYHKYKYDLPATDASDGYVSFSKGYVNADYSLFAIDGNGKIAYCPNGYGTWNLYPRQLPEIAQNKETYQIAVFNNTIYVSFIDSGSHIWKYNLEADEFICIATMSTVQYLPFIMCMAVANYSGSEQLFCFGQSTSPNSSKDAIRIDTNDNITFFAIPGLGSMGVIVQVEVDSLKDIMILNDDGNSRLLLMINGDFPSSAYYIKYSMSITITDFCAMHDNNNWYCLVIDHLKKKIYYANFSGELTQLSDTELSYYNSIPKIAAYQESTSVSSVILMMGGIGCRYSNASPYTSYSNASLGDMSNYMENVVHLDYCPHSNAWFGITKTGKCLFSKDITATDDCWNNFAPYLLDKNGTDISKSIRDIIGAMSHDEVTSLFNEISGGFIRSDTNQSLTDAQKTQARSNIGAIGSDEITSLDPRGPWKFGGKLTKVTDSVVFYTPTDATSARQFSGIVNEFIFKINSITRKSGFEDYSVGITPYLEVNYNRNGTESSFNIQVPLSSNLTSDDEIDAFVGSFFHFSKRHVTSTYAVYEPSINNTDGVTLSPVVMQESMLKNYIVNMTVGLNLANTINQRVDSVDIDFWYR